MRGWEPVWSGLAGQRGHVLASTASGQLLELQIPEAIRAVAEGLEARGVRESGLQAALRAVADEQPAQHGVAEPVRIRVT